MLNGETALMLPIVPSVISSAGEDRLISCIRAWIDPVEMAIWAQLYETTPELALAPKVAELVRSAPAEAQAAFLALTHAFLSAFHLSAEHVAVARAVISTPCDTGWAWLQSLRFEGAISVPDPSGSSPQLAVRIEERAAVVALLKRPVRFLAESVLHAADLWSRPKILGLDVTLEHSSPGRLPAFFDATVASFFFPGKAAAAVEPDSIVQRHRYGARTITGPIGAAARDKAPALSRPESPLPDTAALRASGLEWLDSRKGLSVVDSIEPLRNEVSAYGRTALLPALRRQPSDHVFVDRYYGYTYDREVLEQTAPYGITEFMPDEPVDAIQNCGFLRVPSRKIPRRLVRDRHDLLAALARVATDIPELQIAYRGQRHEYELQRDPAVRRMLYGDAEAREPSLLPSSARRGVDFEAALVEWCSLLNLYLAEMPKHLPTDSSAAAGMRDQHERFANSMGLYLYALALAQHYGLPSTGLDLTDELDIALFFALASFEGTGDRGVRRHSRSRSGEPAVLYVFAIPTRFYLVFERADPGFPAVRPHRQRARFLHGGWGFSQNAAARFLRAALYLDPTGDFGDLPRASQLFPDAKQDVFGAWLLAAGRVLGDSRIKSLIEDSLHWVVE